MLENQKWYKNTIYDPTESTLWVCSNPRRVVLWETYWLRWDPALWPVAVTEKEVGLTTKRRTIDAQNKEFQTIDTSSEDDDDDDGAHAGEYQSDEGGENKYDFKKKSLSVVGGGGGGTRSSIHDVSADVEL